MSLKRRSRWPTLLFLITGFLILYHTFPGSFFPSPPARLPSSLQTCPKTPPWPPITAPQSEAFDWRTIKAHYPVRKLFQLPIIEEKNKAQLPKIQHDFSQSPSPQEQATRLERQAAVKATFKRSWDAYRKYAWKEDELMPITRTYRTTFSGWGATLVDNLDTLLIMNMTDEFEEAVAAVKEIDFRPKGRVNMFEVTIRYLGGLIAAYDLSDCKEPALLEKAIELADMIYASFDTPYRMPVTRWSSVQAVRGRPQEPAKKGIIAEMASFSLELTRLSQLTGDMRYYDAVKRVSDVLASQQMATNIPGLWPVGIDVAAPDLTRGDTFSIGSMADSAYEYLAKTYQLLLHSSPEAAQQYKAMYLRAADAIIQNLLFRPMLPDPALDILFPTSARVSQDGAVVQDHTMQHLACYAGGMFALGAKLFAIDAHLDIAKQLTDGCVWAYRTAPHGIMPESFSLPSCPSASSTQSASPSSFPAHLAPCPWDPDALPNPSQIYPHIASVSDASYHLRPEAIESVFYLYRITGDPAYQEKAWDMFLAIEKGTRTAEANAVVGDAWFSGADGELEKKDVMESFWGAETLKYFWLVFGGGDGEEGNGLGLDLGEWVFNTEAHPFRVR